MSEHSFQVSWKKGALEVIECENCGFRHLYPFPSDEELCDLYKKNFGQAVQPGFIKRKKSDLEYWNLAFDRRLLAYRDLIKTEETGQRRILDVGCGTGNLLKYFLDSGWDVFGVEPNEKFGVELEQNKIPHFSSLVGEVTDAQWDDLGQFDVVNMSLFLEHVVDPFKIVVQVARLLKKGGILTIESPNDFNALQLSVHEKTDEPYWWVSPLHLNYFDFESIEKLVIRAGLQPCSRNAQFPLEMFLHFGDLYVGNSELGREIHLKRVSFETNMHAMDGGGLLHTMYEKFAEIGLGRTAIVHSIKL